MRSDSPARVDVSWPLARSARVARAYVVSPAGALGESQVPPDLLCGAQRVRRCRSGPAVAAPYIELYGDIAPRF
jgi:hypothetical protein